ncbi:MAG: hypothetical protein QG620_589 [Patescibacteria group bacterium]|nr:hypothetical protein [Patescibacteria group bacterium]
MTLKTYLWGARLLILASLAALGFVVFYLNPENAGLSGLAIFYLLLFFALSGIFNFLLLSARRKTMRDEMHIANVSLSFRQGTLLAVLAIGLLVLQSFRMLVWWDALLVVAGIFLIELYFLSRN